MSFWNTLGKIAMSTLENMVENTLAQQADAQRQMGRKFAEYEQKLSNAENSERMNDPAFAKKVHEMHDKIENAKHKIEEESKFTFNSQGEVTIAGKTLTQWDSQWIPLGILSSLTLEELSQYNHNVGLYKAQIGKVIKYIGRAIEYNNGGFRKRLMDYIRPSNSARKHGSGRLMHENADILYISIILVGDSENEVDTVMALEKAMIAKHSPKWNVQFNR